MKIVFSKNAEQTAYTHSSFGKWYPHSGRTIYPMNIALISFIGTC